MILNTFDEEKIQVSVRRWLEILIKIYVDHLTARAYATPSKVDIKFEAQVKCGQ